MPALANRGMWMIHCKLALIRQRFVAEFGWPGLVQQGWFNRGELLAAENSQDISREDNGHQHQKCQ
jgi:hypothetical protein